MRRALLAAALSLALGPAAAQSLLGDDAIWGDPEISLPGEALATPPLARCLADPADWQSCAAANQEMTDGGLEATGPHVLETGVLRLGPSEARADIGSPPSPEPALPVVEADIFFLFDSADFAPGESAKLDRFAVALEDPAAAAVTFLVLGHTDAKGSAAYNCALSARRADALAAALAERGVAAGRLVAIGVGEALPRNAADPTAAENRRVAFAPLKAADADRIVRLARLCP